MDEDLVAEEELGAPEVQPTTWPDVGMACVTTAPLVVVVLGLFWFMR